MNNTTWTQALETVEHRLALGMTDVYLGSDAATYDSLDWSKCVGMDTGGSHRLDISTSVQFQFEDKGLKGRWYFEIEPRSANGSSHYHIDVAGIQRILAVLPAYPLSQFKKYLNDCATAVEKRADEYQEIATKEYGMAGMLRSAAKPALEIA